MPRTTGAVLGTGTMGEPIARNLVRTGFVVRVWNRTREKAERHSREHGTKLANDISDCAA